ncbi:MAG: hypothetical protein IJS90_02400 [Clostridia bacterium]|nr:hypothetical protein [Clostridia bacterium]
MTKQNNVYSGVSFFLGASTPGGFYSLFDELGSAENGWYTYIIKGGPGTGKSTLMKKIAAEEDKRGMICERIHCSSDPSSLDAVIIPSLKTSVADGTHPHTLEPVYPGAGEAIVDLGAFRDDKKLRASSSEIIRLTKENKAKHMECARFLNAAGGALRDGVKTAAGALDLEKTENFISHLASRELGTGSGERGTLKRRFLSAVTPEGISVFRDTADALAEKKIILRDDLGLPSGIITEAFCEAALSSGYDVVKCLCPLSPETKADHIIVPELSLGVFTANRFHDFECETAKSVQCSRFLIKNELRLHKNRLSFIKRAYNEMINEAVVRLSQAKALHDELEKYYIDAMDFDALGECSEKLVEQIFS